MKDVVEFVEDMDRRRYMYSFPPDFSSSEFINLLNLAKIGARTLQLQEEVEEFIFKESTND